MKIYISGKITGTPINQARQKFDEAEKKLTKAGHTVVNPMSLKFKSDCWDHCMSRCIPALLKCDAIHMLPDWEGSKGARIERYIAGEKGLLILYETPPKMDEKEIYNRAAVAVAVVTGYKLSDYAVPSRERPLFFARSLFAHSVVQLGIQNQSKIAEKLNRKPSAVNRALRNYPDELKVNPEFRRMAEKLNSLLCL